MGGDILSEDDGLQMNGLCTSYLSIRLQKKSIQNTLSQDGSPSQNTRSKAQALLFAVEMSGSCLSARQFALCAFSLQFLADFAAAVIDDETDKEDTNDHGSARTSG